MLRATVTVLLLSLSMSMANAKAFNANTTANELLQGCSVARNNQDACLSYISGVLAGMRVQKMLMTMALKSQGEEPSKNMQVMLSQMPFCVPEGFTTAAAFDTFAEMVSQDPAGNGSIRNTGAGFAAVMAVMQKYPCENSEQAPAEAGQESAAAK